MSLSRTLAALMGALSLLLTACGAPLESADFMSQVPSSEPAYHGKPTDYSGTNPISIKARAQFKARTLKFNPGYSSNGLSSVFSTTDIAHAEFHIYSAEGTRIQQGETSANGILTFDIPRKAGSYTISVFSRAANAFIKVSVLEDLYTNLPYSIQKNFTITDSQAGNSNFGTSLSPYDISNSPLVAEADEYKSGKIEGAAFNIMHQIYLANSYIRETIGKNDDAQQNNLNAWWVGDKVQVYWRAGFNPYSYFETSTKTLLSFYVPGDSTLFILGGNDGAVRTVDTDHFDNSVILHEYAHFLEDHYAFSSSPGGSHNGDFIIDARLAWSEGWANFFQGAVRSHFDSVQEGDLPSNIQNSYYIDTFGYKNSDSDKSGGVSIAFNLNESPEMASLDRIHGGSFMGEGTFREVSISRSLFKLTRQVTSPYASGKYGGGIPFADIWKTFAGEDTNGHNRQSGAFSGSLRNSAVYPLPNFGLFNKLLYDNASVATTNMVTILDEEKSLRDESEYGQRLTATGQFCSRQMRGTYESPLSLYDRSNQLRSNDFFLYNHTGGSDSLSLFYEKTGDCSDPSCLLDLDLILYKVDAKKPYVYFEDYWWAQGYTSPDIAAQSRRSPALEPSSGVYKVESINLTSVPRGLYLVNIKLNAYNKPSTVLDGVLEYHLKKGSSYLCP